MARTRTHKWIQISKLVMLQMLFALAPISNSFADTESGLIIFNSKTPPLRIGQASHTDSANIPEPDGDLEKYSRPSQEKEFTRSGFLSIKSTFRKSFTPSKTEIDLSSMGSQKVCEEFVSDRNLGVWGTTIYRLLNSVEHPFLFQGTDDLKKVCPRYSVLNDEYKRHVWILILSSMVYLESTCNPEASGQGPNGEAYGLLQLHRTEEQRYSSRCNPGDSERPGSSFRCGASMLDDQLQRDNRLFSDQSYWAVLRPSYPQAKRIKHALMQFEPCQIKKKSSLPQNVSQNQNMNGVK